jgi:hypothetical protein
LPEQFAQGLATSSLRVREKSLTFVVPSSNDFRLSEMRLQLCRYLLADYDEDGTKSVA